MIRATVRNWHKRNLYAANKLPVSLMCHAQGIAEGTPGGAYFQIRVRSDDKGSLMIIMTPQQAVDFLRQVQHCTERFTP